jgi:hypothetical protein
MDTELTEIVQKKSNISKNPGELNNSDEMKIIANFL